MRCPASARLTPSIAALAVAFAGCGAPDPAEALCLAATSQAMSRVCQGTATQTGPDVSTYQGVVDWAKVKAAGHTFAITRVSDGLNHVDVQFARNWKAMKTAGLSRGTYQFFRPGLDPVAQADLLLAQVTAAGGFQPGDLPPVLDMEAVDGVATATIRARMQAWLDRVQQRTGKRPIIYTAAFMNAVVGTGFGRYPLWVANYGATCPMVPDSWSAWKFWQYTSTGAIAGIAGNVDINRWNGTLAQLKTFAATTVATADAGVKADAGGTFADAGSGPTADAGAEGAVMGDGKALFIEACTPVTGPLP